MAECRSCGAAIIWAVTHKGKRMPVDAAPRSDGNITLRYPGDQDQTPIAEYPGHDHPALFTGAGERYVSHFATCPAADKHRKASE